MVEHSPKSSQERKETPPTPPHPTPTTTTTMLTVFVRHEITVCGWQDVKVQILPASHSPFVTVGVAGYHRPKLNIPTGSTSRGGDAAIYVFDINQLSLPTRFYSVLVSFSVIMALSTVFHSMHSPDSSPLSPSVLPVLFLPDWSFWTIYLVMEVSLVPDIIICGWMSLKHQLTN